MPDDELPKLPGPSKSYQFFSIGFGILIGVLLLVFVVREWVHTSKLANPSVDFTKYLNSHGFLASPATPSKAASLTAGNVDELEVDGKSVWLCWFDTKDPEQAKALASIRDLPTVDVHGKPRPVTVHGTLALIGYDGRTDEKKLLQAFEDFAKAPR
jgi:hypothetical protein